MKVEPQKEHNWLQKMVGEWTSEGQAEMEPGKPPVKWTAIEKVRSIGGLWVVAEGESEMPQGATTSSVMTLGYDSAKQRYVGTFIASMMNNMWLYEGTLDDKGSVLTLETEGPNMSAPGARAKYKDIIEFKSDDLRTLTSRMQGPDGTWTEVMSMEYRRRR